MKGYEIFVLLYFLNAAYILLKTRNVDLFTILVPSLCFYYLPAVLGEVSILGIIYKHPISDATYDVLSIVFFLSILMVCINDIVTGKFHKVPSSEQFLIKIDNIRIFAVIVFLFFVFGVWQTGFANFFSGHKSELAEQATGIYGVSVWMALALLALSVVSKRYLYILISILILLFSLFVGSRSFFATAMIAVWLLVNLGRQRALISLWKPVILVAVLAFFLVGYKVIYRSVRSGNFDAIAGNLSNIDFLLISSLLMADPSAVVYNLDISVNKDITLNSEYTIHRMLSIFPALGGVYEGIIGQDFIRYSSYLGEYYHDTHVGLASSILGEFFALGSFFGVCVAIFMWLTVILLANCSLLLKRNVAIVSMVPFLIYSVFYLHRLDITFVLGAFKTYIFVFFIYIFLYSIYRFLSKPYRKS